MELRNLGRCRIEVPVVGMGTWRTFDLRGRKEESKARTVIDMALEMKANFFDTSPMYGKAERVLSLSLADRRDSALIATKVWSQDVALGQEQISRSLDLFGGQVDLFQIHNLWGWQDYLPILEKLQDEGKILAIGATHYRAEAFTELRRIMLTKRIAAIQIPYSPIQREVEKDILPLASELGIGVVVMRPFAEGSLLRTQPSEEDLKPFVPFGITSWSQELIKWILSDLRCHSTIPATLTPLHLRENS